MKRPPYAKALADRLATGWRPTGKTIDVAVGPGCWALVDSWQGETWRAYFAVPDAEPVDLTIARGWDCIFFAAGADPDLLEHVAVSLILAGASLAVGNIGGRVQSFRGVAA